MAKPKDPKKKFELLTGKITELKKKEKKSGGGDATAEYAVIEQAVNGYVLKLVGSSPEENVMIEATFVFSTKEELFEVLKDNL